MDNDKKIVIALKSAIKKGYNKTFYKSYRDVKSAEETNKAIKNLLKSTRPFLVSRLGATEGVTAKKWLKGKKLQDADIDRIKHLSGVFPKDIELVKRFCKTYSDSISEIDLLGLFYSPAEGYLADRFTKTGTVFSELRGIEPFYHKEPWSQELNGKNVLVIHPFKDSIITQYEKRLDLFDNGLLPKFKSLTVIRAVQSVAGETCEYNDWFEALIHMKREIDKCDFDVAIIGAGAYGLPLGSYIKSTGRSAIHLGGSTQIMFGIKGKRWDTHAEISKLYNDYWKRPSLAEAPQSKDLVEGGTYW